MASQFVDGFAHYATANIFQKYTSLTGTANVQITASPPAGRVGPAMNMQTGGIARKTLTHQSAWVMGIAWYTTGNNFFDDLWIWDHVATTLFRVRLQADGTISLYAGPSTFASNLIANSGTVGFSIHQNTWYYIEVSFSLSGATPITCSATLRVNGTTLVSGSGVSTGINAADLLLGTATANNYAITANINGQTYFKDSYTFDETGAFNTGFAGDVTFLTVFPDGDVTTNWTPTGGGTSFNQVNENPPDEDVTYIESATPGDVDNFTWQDIPNSYTIIAVQYLAFARKTAEGTKSIKQTVGPTGGFEQESPEWFLPDDYIYNHFSMDVDPATAAPWTVANFNAKNFGIEVIS